MKKPFLSRRAFLRGAGAGAAAVPLLRGLRAFAGEEPVYPKRLVIFFTPNGTVHEHWRPTGGEASFNLSTILDPLEPFKQKLLILDGVDLKTADVDYSADMHATGMCHALTGTRMAYGAGGLTGGGISVDQFIAERVGGETRFRSLEFGVQTQPAYGYDSYWTRVNFSGPGEPVPPEDDPYEAFDRIFSALPDDPADPVFRTITEERRSVLDVVQQDLLALQAKLGAEDRLLLDSHLTSIREIETRLERLPAVGKFCETPTLGPRIDDVQNMEFFPEVTQLQLDLLAMSLACDLTRVSTMQLSRAVAPTIYRWIGATYFDAHTLSHYADGNPVWGEDGEMTQMCVWYAEQVAYLLGKLDAIPEGTGTLLDHTLVVWANELGRGNTHSHDVPWVLAGGANGAMRMGRYLEYDHESHNDLLVSICRAMDVNVSTFGDEEFCNGALARLT